jgi:tetratricopeptide (TPR) repeat protein
MSKINHQETALVAYNEAVSAAEQTIKAKHLNKDGNDRAMMLLDLAEFHILVNTAWKAETEYLEALDYYLRSDDSSSLDYQIYIYKALSGIHACMGRKQESKKENRKAEKLEERLMASNRLVAMEKDQ